MPFPETMKLRIRAGLFYVRKRTRAERVFMKSSVAEHYGCKSASHCGLIANGAVKRIEIFPVRNMLIRSLRRKKESGCLSRVLRNFFLARILNQLI